MQLGNLWLIVEMLRCRDGGEAVLILPGRIGCLLSSARSISCGFETARHPHLLRINNWIHANRIESIFDYWRRGRRGKALPREFCDLRFNLGDRLRPRTLIIFRFRPNSAKSQLSTWTLWESVLPEEHGQTVADTDTGNSRVACLFNGEDI